jgi:hypothetical protein
MFWANPIKDATNAYLGYVVVVVLVLSIKRNSNNFKVNCTHKNEFSSYTGKLR